MRAEVVCGLHREIRGRHWGNRTNSIKIIRFREAFSTVWAHACTGPHSDTLVGHQDTAPVVEVLSGPRIP
ncbi:hypothetical protein [Saccharothrix xinjiangensis]|uniref:Uncharacterized protein n=1 Tax=Saccharothrix xinjiangensis TaxID=204798 RepID=A0ABV9YCI8_9PSEU